MLNGQPALQRMSTLASYAMGEQWQSGKYPHLGAGKFPEHMAWIQIHECEMDLYQQLVYVPDMLKRQWLRFQTPRK
jgi:hypothetical protein